MTRVAIVVAGSRGDVQPFIALALELKMLGVDVKLCCTAEMRHLCTPYLDESETIYMPYSKAQTYLRDDPAMRKAMEEGDFMKIMGAMGNETMVSPWVEDGKFLLKTLPAFDPQLVVFNTPGATHGSALAEALKVPSTLVTMQMMLVSSYEAPMIISPQTAAWLPSCVVRLLWHLLFVMMSYSPLFKRYDSEVRCKCIEGARPMTYRETVAMVTGTSKRCSLVIARSPLLSPPPPDWSHPVTLVGPLILDASLQVKAWPPSASLKSFLADADKPPIYFGWGSMIAGSPLHMVDLVCRTLMAVGRRGVVLGGWAELRAELLDSSTAPDASELRAFARSQIHFIEQSAPHEWLFPQMDAIVHHGGAGTTGSALRAGVPSIITPCAFDQPEIAAKVERQGGGIGLQQFHRVTVAQMTAAVARAISDPVLRTSAAKLGAALRNERGAATTAALIAKRAREQAGEQSEQDVELEVHAAPISPRVRGHSRNGRVAPAPMRTSLLSDPGHHNGC